MPFATVTLASAGFDVPTLNAEDFEGTRHSAYRSYTHASGADTGEVDLLKLPAGRIKVYSIASHIQTSQFAAGALLDIGTRAYTHEDGTDVVEDPDRFALDLAKAQVPCCPLKLLFRLQWPSLMVKTKQAYLMFVLALAPGSMLVWDIQ